MKSRLVNVDNQLNYTDMTFRVMKPDLVQFPESEYYNLTIKKYREDRSLDANAYYWTLVRQIAHNIDSSVEEVHNQLLDSYGVMEMDDEGKPIKVLMKDSFDYMRATDIHLHATPYTTELSGVTYRLFYKLKPSHEMDTQEMAKLIDGAKTEVQL